MKTKQVSEVQSTQKHRRSGTKAQSIAILDNFSFLFSFSFWARFSSAHEFNFRIFSPHKRFIAFHISCARILGNSFPGSYKSEWNYMGGLLPLNPQMLASFWQQKRKFKSRDFKLPSIVTVPICMPPDGADYTGKVATVSGWGRLKYGGGVPSVLQEVQVSHWKRAKLLASLEKKIQVARRSNE